MCIAAQIAKAFKVYKKQPAALALCQLRKSTANFKRCADKVEKHSGKTASEATRRAFSLGGGDGERIAAAVCTLLYVETG